MSTPEWDMLSDRSVIRTLRPQRLDAEKLQGACLQWLDDAERGRYASLKTPTLRHEYLAAHALCRVVLGKISGTPPAELQFHRGRFGKPRVAGTPHCRALHFNLSHTDDFAACIVSRLGPVGIDVERSNRPVEAEQVARHFFSPAARQTLASLPASDRQAWFYRQWVLREALLKARGLGLAGPLNGEPIVLDADNAAIVDGRWRVFLVGNEPGLVMAAAVRSRTEAPPSIQAAGEALLLAALASA